MTQRRRKRRKPSHGRTLREILEENAAAFLTERAIVALEDAKEELELEEAILDHAARRIQSVDVGAEEDARYARAWEWRIAEVIASSDRRKLVHGFLSRIPLYLLATPREVANAVWTDLLHSEVAAIVDDVLHECDADGEPRYIEGPDERFRPNPHFTEPG